MDVERNAEPELFPCLRKFGISFYEFNPRASVDFLRRILYLLTRDLMNSRVAAFSQDDTPDAESTVEAGSRFEPEPTAGIRKCPSLPHLRRID